MNQSTNQPQPVYAKNIANLEECLEYADEAFGEAADEAGRVVVSRMKRCLQMVKEVDARWARLHFSLQRKDYDACVRCVRSFIHSFIQ